MRKSVVRRLTLAKETLRVLTDSSVAKAVAGNRPPATQAATVCETSSYCEFSFDCSSYCD
jgi:hypothetical protein